MASTSTRVRSAVRVRPKQDNDSGVQLRPLGWLWPTLWMVLLAGSGLFCGWALLWLTRIPPLPDCDNITPFHSSSDMLYCAKAQARTGEPNNLTQAVLLTVNWPATDANYEDAQAILKDASEQILVLSNRWAQAGRLEDAVKLAGTIPLNTPLRSSAQAVIFEWRQAWEQGQALEAQIEAALAAQDWEQAKGHLNAFKDLQGSYWNTTRHNHWHHQTQLEQQAWDQLLQARAKAASSTPVDLQAAIALAREINLSSQVWIKAETEVDQWGQQLLAAGLTEWNNGNQDAALALASQVPPSPDLDPAAADLLRLAQAQRLVAHSGANTPGAEPHYGHVLNLMEAIAAVQQIPADSAFAATSQPNLDTWQAQLEDLQRLKFSAMVAKLGRKVTYQWAEAQALQVEVDRPRRIQGQTLIANWRANIQRIEDRPTLIQARTLAQPGTIPALRLAMDKASQVELGRALRGEAQTLIAAWQDEIQVIEDRPMLDAAVALANQGKLKEAIQEARKIQTNRALHDRAQTLIQDWTTEIQVAEDRPILDRAKNLAYAGSLTAAINLASQIAPGRALHPEARSAIARWQSERAYIWSIWEAEGRRTPAEANPDSSESE
ncbi:hypothetical protein [Phormidium sp. FACHB-1136]|uniref:hypothetical protein n=1 Tax=Phormidium sp. FACHB-1136 TaxID=2692848 RepID=UPI001689735E|nr:hypothetical protein [Phormidium sp. FACHB-1136]MBD2425779.1 hypothetical protein [Phormidium sp. FACHB-1136]